MAHTQGELNKVAAAVAEAKQLILKKGLSLSKAAEAVGLPKGTLSKHLAGVDKVQDALRVSAGKRHLESKERKRAYNREYLKGYRTKP